MKGLDVYLCIYVYVMPKFNICNAALNYFKNTEYPSHILDSANTPMKHLGYILNL